ncbi:hypothetical protein RHECIAT_CH0002646 [Rhizobium etli CIAT 652]|uniref:Uncharacterized protein n=1 Tax=Rhizobium etli (strain CIAT 652) TaxID=491916 RepID=B3PRN8_RHIE6|nr:hypothetical protein RHECIAT_CH0002646 [Rhizobium etli CIAT 652]
MDSRIGQVLDIYHEMIGTAGGFLRCCRSFTAWTRGGWIPVTSTAMRRRGRAVDTPLANAPIAAHFYFCTRRQR